MQKYRSLRTIAIMAIIFSILGLVVGYSALNQTLIITNKTTVKGATWSVHFDTSSLSEPILVGEAKKITDATITATNISIDVSLTKPNDSVTYTFDVKNDGTIDAKLNEVPSLTGITEATAQNVTFSLTYEDGTTIAKDDTLNASQSRTLKLIVSMNDVETVSSEDVILNLSATMFYVQK